jgi:hypothetical protein
MSMLHSASITETIPNVNVKRFFEETAGVRGWQDE